MALPRGLRLRPHALQFVKVPSSVAPSVLFDLLLDEWHLPTPNLVVSLVGVEQPFTMKSWLRDVLRKGLVKAVESTGEAPSWSRALGTPQPSEYGAPQPLTPGRPWTAVPGPPSIRTASSGSSSWGCSREAEGGSRPA